jgi:hypothetical protein
MRIFSGIADDLGIESFRPAEYVTNAMLGMWQMRCRCNMHRNAVVYRVTLTDETVKAVEELLAEQKCVEALVKIQEEAVLTEVEKGKERLWMEIPKVTYKRKWKRNEILDTSDPRQGTLPGMEKR